MYVLGDYGRQIDSELLLFKYESTHPTGHADLQGVRLAVSQEVEQGRRMAEGVVKQLTGGDRLTARRMRQDFFQFDPTHKLFVCANHMPEIRGTDYAIWRRIDRIPWNVTIPDDEQDPDLLDKLKVEAPGILAWAVKGCLDWQASGV